jgi:hypothetical protein
VSAASRRAASLELRVARALGVKRNRRSRYEFKADIEAVRLPCGVELTVEIKHRKTLPALIRQAMEQAEQYAPGLVPVAVLQPFGGQPVVVMPLDAFRQIAGLSPVAAGQLSLIPKAG